MKKTILCFWFIVIILVSVSGCASSSTNTTSEVPDTTSKSGDKISSSESTSEESIPDSPSQGSAIEYLFYSIADMEKYINSGSRNTADYSKPPSIPLEDFPEIALSNRYISLISILGIDEKLFSCHEASFQLTEGGKIKYCYYLDNVMIMIEEIDYSTPIEQYMEKFDEYKKNNLLDYQIPNHTSATVQEGFVLRQSNSTKLVYKMQNGIKKSATILIERYAVTINGTWYSNQEKIVQDYQEFLTSEKTAGIAALFSDDPKTFETSIKTVVDKVTK